MDEEFARLLDVFRGNGTRGELVAVDELVDPDSGVVIPGDGFRNAVNAGFPGILEK